jgi:hypothetical protein
MNNPRERQMERTRRYQCRLVRSITKEIWLLFERYQGNFGAKGLFTLKLGACVDIIFLEKQVKKDKER